MHIRRVVPVAAVLLAIPALTAAAGWADAPNGGCHQGSTMTGRLLPGTGSAGQNIQWDAGLSDCVSRLLPGITAGHFQVSIPWNVPEAVTRATFRWSDGTVSTATGYGNGIWSITAGPGAGHAIQVNTPDGNIPEGWDGWYYSPVEVTVASADFIS